MLGTDTLPDGRQIIVTDGSLQSWNRGHIAPDSDFIMDYQQDATYYFINIAPQFGQFNQRNWRFLEDDVRGKSYE